VPTAGATASQTEIAHDDESKIVSPSFTTFLQEWQNLRYIGPESWMLDPFLDDHGNLNSATPSAVEFLQHFERAMK